MYNIIFYKDKNGKSEVQDNKKNAPKRNRKSKKNAKRLEW